MAGSERVGRRIMVVVNESEESMHALQRALDNVLNQQDNELIIVMHAQPPPASKIALAGHGNIPIFRFSYNVFSFIF